MQSYIIQSVLGAAIGFVGNYLPIVKNNQSTITNVVLGLVGSVGGNFAATQSGLLGADAGLGSSIGTGVVGSVVGLLAGKLFGKK
jgi:uncharacterized membrane protein YeaQ/YmgE (transglycosylase-associated protein family)